MKFKAIVLLTALALLLSLVGAAPAQAAGYGTAFVTSITYQNVGAGPATINIDFYAESSATPITITLPTLAANAGSSLWVGSINEIASGFQGSAVMSSNEPLVATLVQGSTTLATRPLSNGFAAGAPQVLVPTVLKNTFGYTSVVSIQNVDSVNADLNVEFVPVSGSAFTVAVENLPPGAAKYYDMGKFTHGSLGATFNGSMRVTAWKDGTSKSNPANGSVIATSLEAGTSVDLAYAFEGATETSNTIYMPSAFCKYLAANYTSTYAVQNVGASPINITVTYNNGKTETYNNIPGGAKKSIPGCGDSGNLNPAGFIGSATVTATGQIVGMAKISNQQGLLTAFLGFPSGGSKIALPFVRWTEAHWLDRTRSRAVLAIQNLGPALAAGAVKVNYYDKNGVLVVTHNMPAVPSGGKVNSNPKDAGAGNEFGYYSDGSFGGSATVVGPPGSQLAVIVRISTATGSTTLVGEDYNGIPIP